MSEPLTEEHLEGLERFSWRFRQADFRWRIENSPLETFATWPVSQETIYTGDTVHVRAALEVLKKWEHWQYVRKALKEPSYMPSFPLLNGSSGTMIHQALCLYMFRQLGEGIGVEPRIVEFGGGYGAMARVITNFPEFYGTYTIYDLPELLEIQRFYLGETIVRFIDNLHEVERADLVFAFHSLAEVPYDLRDRFLSKAEPKQLLALYTPEYDGVDEGVYNNDEYFRGWAENNDYYYTTRTNPADSSQTYFYARRWDES